MCVFVSVSVPSTSCMYSKQHTVVYCSKLSDTAVLFLDKQLFFVFNWLKILAKNCRVITVYGNTVQKCTEPKTKSTLVIKFLDPKMNQKID